VTHKSVRRTKREISAREFAEWQEYYKQEPFGDDWLQSGVVAAYSVAPWSKKGLDPVDIVRKATGTVAAKTDEEIKATLMRYARMHNAACDAREKRKAK